MNIGRIELVSLAKIPRIYLTGARGSGKSTVGRLLAQSLGYGFCDLDNRLCAKAGKSVAEIVEEGGWPAFRELERATLLEASLELNLVFATGGGVVLDSRNREHLRGAGAVIWLDAPVEVMSARLARNPQAALRPNLTEKGLLEEISDILKERRPLYLESCHHAVDAAGEPEEVCANILRCLGVYAR